MDARELKQLFQESWAQSDDLKSLQAALSEKGLYLAKGDRRGVVALDIDGNIYALARWSGVRSKEVKARFGPAPDLKPVAEVGTWLQARKTDQIKSYIAQVKEAHAVQMQPFFAERATLVQTHRSERKNLRDQQEQRWATETKARSDRLNAGLRGLFDRLTGAHQKMISRNEGEALTALRRDQAQRDGLIDAQIRERRELQWRVKALKAQQRKERRLMARTIALYLKRPERSAEHRHDQDRSRQRPRGPTLGFDR